MELDEEIERTATEYTLRLLHAKQAERLALISWKNNNDEEIFLIDNAELRQSYGRIIGLIAYSHWWKVDDIESKFNHILGAPGIFPQSWTIDPLKLACIIRIADAIQIDDRRAPSFLKTIRKLSNYSKTHWDFQQKLYQPRLERNRLVFTTKLPFTVAEADSWWLCYDTLKMINDELISVDSLLHDTNRQRLNANGISAIEDPKRLTKLISVEGWQPVDANIKVSDVAKLVGCIGGAQLYGDNVIVPLRELIQNASDAIRARRILENEGENYGHIIIRTGKEKNEHYYIEVEDNGIGMSQRVLTGPFLDFGKSLWGTSLMHEELPGLEVKGFSSTGKYGIVFFSVFMWGKRVTIATRRYEAGREKTKILEFNDGIAVRPILRKAGSNEFIKSGGTRIRVWLKDAGVLEKMLMRNCHKEKKKSFEEIIENLCPSIDCDILFEKNSINRTIINANDWKQISSYKLLQRIIGKSTFNSLTKDEKQFLQKLSKNMRFVKGLEGEIVGRALIYKEPFGLKRKDFLDGVVTVGGFRTTHLSGIIGIFIGKSDRASRDIGIPIVTNQALQEWATDQADLISDLSLELDSELECASIIRECGGETKQLKIAFNKNGSCNYNEIENYIKEQNNDSYLVIQDASVHIYERDHSCKVEFMENVFWSDSGQPGIFQYHGDYRYIEWPDNGISWFHSQTLQGLIIEALCEVWDTGVNGIIKVSDISSDNEHFDSIVGYANGKEVIFDHLDTVRKPK